MSNNGATPPAGEAAARSNGTLTRKLPPEAELHYTRGLLHLRRGEAVMPASMAIPEEKAPPGTDVLLALLGLATVATSRALKQTGWIEKYRAEMRAALGHLDRAAELAPDYPDIHFRRAQALRYLGETGFALEAARSAYRLAPESREYAALLRVLETNAGLPTSVAPAVPVAGGSAAPPPRRRDLPTPMTVNEQGVPRPLSDRKSVV